MDRSAIKPGIPVRVSGLGKASRLIVGMKQMAARKAGVTGTVIHLVPGHSGEAWFVQHDGSETIGAYVFDELEPA